MPFLLGAGTTGTVITEAHQTLLKTQFENLSSDLGTWLTNMLPVFLSVVGVFILIWLARLGIRLLKSMSNSAK